MRTNSDEVTCADELSSAARVYVSSLMALHQLIAAGAGDSEDADGIRDQMDGPWRSMPAGEIALMRALSVDLYALAEHTELNRAPVSPDPAGRESLSRMKEAFERRRWYDALDLLGPTTKYLPPVAATYLKARCWQELGCPAVALTFLEAAVAAEPRDANLQWLRLELLLELGQRIAVEHLAREILAAEGTADPRLLLKTGDVFFHLSKDEAGEREAELLREAEAALLVGLRAAERLPHIQIAPSILAGGYTELGLCREYAGDTAGARLAYDRAVAAHPGNEAALTARGVLLYATAPAQAMADLRAAAAAGGNSLWPRFYLAHHAVISGAYGECVDHCEAALRLQPSPSMAALLLEWSAIAHAEQGSERAVVLALFADARAQDPASQRIVRNQAAFLDSVGARGAGWDVMPDTEARPIWLREYIPAMAAPPPEYIPVMAA